MSRKAYVTTFLVAVMIILASAFYYLPYYVTKPGMVEMTLGAQLSSSVTNPNLLQQVIITSFILAFSGLSVQAQVASILAETDIRFAPFFFARILHGFISAILAYILWKPLYIEFSHFEKVTMDYPTIQMTDAETISLYETLMDFGPLFTIISLILYIFILIKQIRYE